MTFGKELDAVQREAKILKDAGVKVIVVLSHAGYRVDQKIAAEVSDIDVIVGGHSHTFLYKGSISRTSMLFSNNVVRSGNSRKKFNAVCKLFCVVVIVVFNLVTLSSFKNPVTLTETVKSILTNIIHATALRFVVQLPYIRHSYVI